MIIRIFVISLSFLLLACSNQDLSQKKMLAQYNNQYLYYNDISEIIPKGISKSDSLKFLTKVKNDWLFQKIIIQKAENYLSKSDLNIKYLVEKYKADLLKYKYENYYIKKKLNTNINNQELIDYYEKNKNAFLAQTDLAKIILIKIDKKTPRRYVLRQWLGSKNKKYQQKLQEYCFKYAIECNDFDNQWVSLNEKIKNIQLDKLSHTIKEHELIENKDSAFYYYIYIEEFIKKGEIAPLSYIKEDVAQSILYRKKAELIQNLEQSINEEVKKINTTYDKK
jgi:hypothetical protein